MRFADRIREDDGYILPLVLVVLLVALAFGAAAMSNTLATRTHANYDSRERRAQQGADAGIQTQLYQQQQQDFGSSTYNFNGGPVGTSNFLDCTVPQVNASGWITGVLSTYANSAGICPQGLNPSGNSTTVSPAAGNSTTYSSEMITGQTNLLNGTSINGQNGSAMRELFPKIISIGTESSDTDATGNVYSREVAILAPIAPLQAVEGQNSVTLDSGLSSLGLSAAALNGDVLSRGNLATPSALAGLNLTNGLVATLVYSGTLSGGLKVANVQKLSQSSIISRPTISVASSKPDCGTSTGTAEACTGLISCTTSCYNAATDSFSLTTGTATISAGDYVLCNFTATGGTINLAPTSSQPVRIYIDSPTSSRCAGDGLGSNQGNFNDVAGFTNGLLDGTLDPSSFQVYVVGNGTGDGTTVQIGPTSWNAVSALTYGVIVYAPTSQVKVNVPALCTLTCTGGLFEGAVVGYDTTVNALTITQDLNIGNYPLYAGINALRPVQYVQCDTSVTSLSQSTSDLNGC